MTNELRDATPEEKTTHEQMMKKTMENIEKQKTQLEERKKRNLEGLMNPPQKRFRGQREETRKSNYKGNNRQQQPLRRYGPGNRPRATTSSNSTATPTHNLQQTSTPMTNNQADMATLATLLSKLLPASNYVQQQPSLLQPTLHPRKAATNAVCSE